ncbi:MAG: DNA gyrase subunit A [Candidatus Marinimicrobia bacterium]|nr:DNA gyrase subunit A [Candidatus Neomarinimicrobiota bacterium]MDD5582779.1 DNA gyrase subunit A [Candidatus Neomarinimicrobiota bacterium]
MTNQRIIPVNIEEELKDSYIDYSMSVIISRALPDVCDGLKPVHRRILYGMNELGVQYNRSYKKSARIVGEVMGKYHPHGDASVYDAMVRLAQSFAMRYPLVDGQGNFGSIDGDNAAAMRYTEARMARLASELLVDIDKETVEFRPNFDETLQEPTVLPTRVPLLLVNGASGIAVGMATNIPPHNMNEICDALCALVDNPEMEIQGLMKYIKGPDFPTGGFVFGSAGLHSAYLTGRGKVQVRARASIEQTRSGKEQIVITEIPYQVNKSNVLENIADLVRDKVIDGISDLRDESDKDGIRIVIELKRDAIPEVVLNNLYKHTQLQTTFGIILLALVNGIPRILNLKEILAHFIEFRHDIIVKRTQYDLAKAEEAAHILEGLKVALDNIDEVIKIIRAASNVNDARDHLMARFEFSEKQAQAILDMRLQKLTGLERDKIVQEYLEKLKLIEQLKFILENKAKRMEILKGEFDDIKSRYGDSRRTDIIADNDDFTLEDMIADEEMVITITHNGFIKRSPVSSYRTQNRGGVGKRGAATRDEDFVENLFIASTHEYMLFFTSIGKVYWLKVHQIPQAGRVSRGRAIVNLLECEKGESVRAFLNVRDFSEDRYVVMSTQRGMIKKTPLSAFSHPRRTGILAIKLRENDNLVGVDITNGSQDIILGTLEGKAIRFNEKHVRDMGRTASGVRGITLSNKEDRVVDMVVVKREGASVLAVSERGFGKRSEIVNYRVTNRGGKGVITLKTIPKIGKMVALKEVVDTDDLMLITIQGLLIRIQVRDIRVYSRNTQGVRLINLKPDDKISSVAYLKEDNNEENGEE